MAAPTEAYTGLSLFTGDCEHRQAILDPNYATFKTRFYLDEVVGTKEGIFGCVNPSGDNATYHNLTTRGGKGRAGNLQILNDGGLNTKGKVIINSNSLQWANNIRNNYTFTSAWWVDSDFNGVRYRVGSGSWAEINFLPNLNQQETLTADKTFDSGFAKGDLLEIQGVIKNAEGDKYSSSLYITLLSRIYGYLTYKRTTACISSGETSATLWVTDDTMDLLPTVPEDVITSTGIYLYKDIEQTIKADIGWYAGLLDDKIFNVDSNGQILEYTVCADSKGSISMSVRDVGDLFDRVRAFVDPIWASSDVVITGRIDIHPTSVTASGKDFTITVLAGEANGYEYAFNLDRIPGETYYWQGVLASPTGFTITTVPII